MWEAFTRIFAVIGVVGTLIGIIYKGYNFYLSWKDRIRNEKMIFNVKVLFVEKFIRQVKIKDRASFIDCKGIVLRIRNTSDFPQQITKIEIKSISDYLLVDLAMFDSFNYVDNNYFGEIEFCGNIVFPIKIEARSSKDIYIKSPDFERILACANCVYIETGDGKIITQAPFEDARRNIDN